MKIIVPLRISIYRCIIWHGTVTSKIIWLLRFLMSFIFCIGPKNFQQCRKSQYFTFSQLLRLWYCVQRWLDLRKYFQFRYPFWFEKLRNNDFVYLFSIESNWKNLPRLIHLLKFNYRELCAIECPSLWRIMMIYLHIESICRM